MRLTFRVKPEKIAFRSSCPEVFYKKGVLRNFAKFTGKHLCQSLIFNKLAGLRPNFILDVSMGHMNKSPISLKKKSALSKAIKNIFL